MTTIVQLDQAALNWIVCRSTLRRAGRVAGAGPASPHEVGDPPRISCRRSRSSPEASDHQTAESTRARSLRSHFHPEAHERLGDQALARVGGDGRGG
jgi:hypothetical protein